MYKQGFVGQYNFFIIMQLPKYDSLLLLMQEFHVCCIIQLCTILCKYLSWYVKTIAEQYCFTTLSSKKHNFWVANLSLDIKRTCLKYFRIRWMLLYLCWTQVCAAATTVSFPGGCRLTYVVQ